MIHKTSIYPPAKIDLKQDLNEIEEYTRNYIPQPPRYGFLFCRYASSSYTHAVSLLGLC